MLKTLTFLRGGKRIINFKRKRRKFYLLQNTKKYGNEIKSLLVCNLYFQEKQDVSLMIHVQHLTDVY
jgi:hypothetical protein